MLPITKQFALSLLLSSALLATISIESIRCSNLSRHDNQVPASPDQWLIRYTCNKTEFGQRDGQKSALTRVRLGDECDQDPSRWQMNYVSEFGTQQKFNVLIRESSLDERLSNSLNLVKQMKAYASYGLRVHPGAESDEHNNEQLLDSLAGDQVDDWSCGEHLDQMIELGDDLSKQLEAKRQNPDEQMGLNESHIQLARVMDSFGRYDSGYFSGRYHSMGAYEQCQGSRLLLRSRGGADETIRTRYCWAHLNLTKQLHPSLVGKRMSAYVFEENFLNVALCLPETCHTRSFETNKQNLQRLVDRQFKLPQMMYLEENLELSSIYCLVDETSEYLRLSIGARLFILALASWLIAAVYVTIKLNRQRKQIIGSSRQVAACSLMSALDIASSWNDLLCNKQKVAPVAKTNELIKTGQGEDEDEVVFRPINLDSLNGIKIMLYTQVLYGHAGATLHGFSTNILRSASLGDTYMIFLAGRVYFSTVDIFFTIGGLLVGYLGVKRATKWLNDSNPLNKDTTLALGMKQLASIWFKLAASRYIRIVPLLFVLFWFEKTLYMHLGSGPMWDHGLDNTTMLGGCLRTSWTRPFDFITPVDNVMNCVTSAWYIYCDLFAQMLFVPPLVYLLASRRVKLAYLITISLIAVSTLGAAMEFANLKPALSYELRQLETATMFMRAEQWKIYMNPFFRLPRVLIGLLAGHVLYCYSCRVGELRVKADQLCRELALRWPSWFRGPATWVALLMMLATTVPTLFTVQIKQHMYPDYYSFAFQQVTVTPLIWCTSVAIVLLRLVTDWQDHWLSRSGTNKLIIALNKLSFIIYLIHWYIYIYNFTTKSSLTHPSVWSFISNLGYAIFYSILLSMPIFVFIENPLYKFLKRLIPI